MLRNKISRLLPIGLACLGSGLLIHNSLHGRYVEFSSGVLIGVSLVFIIAGFAAHSRQGN